jgi:hypothetical protein
MSTTYNYDPLASGWDSKVANCCNTNTTNDSGCTDCCYDTWQDQLKDVTQRSAAVTEKTTQLNNKITFIADRRGRYKIWLDELDKAETLARNICHQLEILATQADKIWYNASKACKAVETLFCMVRDFYGQVDYIKKRYDDLQICIQKNDDPALEKGKGILKALDDYGTRLNAIIATRDALVAQAIEAIKLANLIIDAVTSKDCTCDFKPCDGNYQPFKTPNDGKHYYGLKTIITSWYNVLGCASGCPGDNVPAVATPNQFKKPGTQPSAEEDNCGPDNGDGGCELTPLLSFPICADSYRASVQSLFDKDDKALVTLSKKLKEANKDKEALDACKSSLTNAIAVVDPKSRCN